MAERGAGSLRRCAALAVGALALAALPAVAEAKDPGRWHYRGFQKIKPEYFQGTTSSPALTRFFDGPTVGLYRTDSALRETGRNADVVPADVLASERYNHIGDISWDRAEGGRILLPLECYTIGAPNGGNTCGTGAIGVADPATLAWRYYVKLDPAEIRKAMWCEASPDGSLLWTSAGTDLLAYRMADVSAANAAPTAAPIRAVRRLARGVPPSGITGATFIGSRLFVAGSDAGPFQVWSVDVNTGSRRLEIERSYKGESEGLDHLVLARDLGAQTNDLYWMIQPVSFSGPPTFGVGHGALLHFVSRGRATRLQPLPPTVRAGVRTSFRFRVTTVIDGRRIAVSGVRVDFAGLHRRTGAEGIAAIRTTLHVLGRRVARASRPGLDPARATVTVTS